MNESEIEQFSEMVYADKDKLQKELNTELEEIAKATKFSTMEASKMTKNLQNAVKYLYSKQNKSTACEFEKKTDYGHTNKYELQISKRGIGVKHPYETNMRLVSSLTDDTSGGYYYTISIKKVMTDKTMFDALHSKLNENGQKVMEELRDVFNKYDVKPIKKKEKLNVKLTPALKKYFGVGQSEVAFLNFDYNDNHIEVQIINDAKGYRHNDFTIFIHNRTESNLANQVGQMYFYEVIKEHIKEYHAEIQEDVKNWENFIEEYNQVIAKYTIVSMI